MSNESLNLLLPYETKHTSEEWMRIIKLACRESLASGLLTFEWVWHLHQFLKLNKNEISIDDRIYFVQLLYALICEVEIQFTERFIQPLVLLFKYVHFD
jgi:hypothetical protein